jgi:16S rRNA (guanine527-N7)-methyltransferase
MSVATPPERSGHPPDFLADLKASPALERDVERFRYMLVEANRSMNLVGDSTLGDFWRRHFIDSAQLLWFAPKVRVWADLGSGAGLPGLILAILLRDRPGACVHMVESMTKRCQFLAGVVKALDLPARVHNARAESLALEVEMVTARACAPLDRLLGYAQPYFARGARGLFLKGVGVGDEIIQARKTWAFRCETWPSLSDDRGRLLSIEELARA